jgi:hypothetical protein
VTDDHDAAVARHDENDSSGDAKDHEQGDGGDDD